MTPEQQKFLAIMACLALQINTTDAKNTLVTGSCGANATYTIYDDYSMIISGNGKIYSLVPDDEGYYRKVVDERWSMVKTVTIQEGITGIDMGAFSECTELTDIEIPQSVKSIDGFAFSGCSKLSSFTFPSSIAVYNNVFNNCVNLTHLHIADGADFICPIYSEEDNPFAGCPIEYLYMGGNILSGPEGEPLTTYYANRYGRHAAFEYVNTLKTLEIGDQVTIIEDYCFSGCPIENLTIGKNVAKIGYAAFANAKLTSPLIIPASIGAIGSGQHFPSTLVLEDCDSPLSIFGPYFSWSSDFCNDLDSVYVGRNFLVDDSEDITMPNIRSLCINTSFEYLSHEREGDEIHYDSRHILWNNIENLYFKDNAVLGNRAFVHASITNIYDLPNVGDGAFYNCHIKNVKFSDKTTVIGRYAFYNTDITEISIPFSVTSIDEAAFSDCSSLSSVTIQTNTPPSVGMNVFDGVPLSSATLYVPVGAKDTYTSAKGWQSFGSIIELGPVPDYFTAINPDGTTIRYRKLSDTECEVTYLEGEAKYSSDITIPASVIYAGHILSVTAIGRSAFLNCESLTSITIPNSVSIIDNEAFNYCTHLSSITLPNLLSTIGSAAFYDCRSLKSINIPNYLSTIGDVAFHGCSSLKSIKIPYSTITIGSSVFRNCFSLNSITVDSANPNYTSLDGVLFNKDQSHLICCPAGKQGDYTIPNGVTSISDDAFWVCTSLTSITIPKTLSDIGSNRAFFDCASLTAINVEAANPCYSSLEGVLFNKDKNLLICCPGGKQGDYTLPNSTSSIEEGAFRRCRVLSSVTLPSSVISIGEIAFWECTSLNTVNLPSSLTNIGSYAFMQCNNLRTVYAKMQSPIEYDDFFNGCDLSQSIIYVPSTAVNAYQNASGWKDFGTIKGIVASGNCGAQGDNLTWTLSEDGVLTISGSGAMKNYDSHYNDLTYNPHTNYAPWDYMNFEFWDNLGIWVDVKSIILPNGITRIGDCAFSGCSLTTVEIPSSVMSIGDWAFEGCGLTSINIPSSVERIGNGAFDCHGLTSVEIPSSVTSIGYRAFPTSMTSIVVDANNPVYDSRNNCNGIIETVTNELIIACESTIIPSTVTSIGEKAFFGCSMTSIELPSSVTNIGFRAFEGCRSLTSFDIPSSVTSIGRRAFANSGLTSIKIPASVTEIEESTFGGCDKLASIEIPSSVTYIGYSAFFGCDALSSIKIPSSVTSIESSAFSGSGLTSIEIPSSVTVIGNDAFNACSNLISVTIPSSITKISVYAFVGCDNLSSITITSVDNSDNILSAIEDSFYEDTYSSCILYVPVGTKSAFQNAPGWKNFINIEEIVASGNCGAEGDNLTWTLSEDGVLTISGSGKMTDSSPWINYREIIKSVIISEGATSIGVGAFEFCRNLTSIEIPSTVTSIREGAFAYTALTSIEIPSSVTNIAIGIAIFEGCNALTSITIDESNPIYDSRDGCNAIIETATNQLIAGCQRTIIPSSVTSIGGAAFYECGNLTSIVIPSSVTIIGGFTFYHCFNLSSITITSVDDSDKILYALEDSYIAFDDDTYSSCILYVPAGTKSAFQNATGWKNFVNIEEYGVEPDTDISEYENILYMPSTEVRRGRQSTLEIHLKNSALITAFAFDLHLPAGFSVAKNAKGKDMIMLFEDRKADDHTLTSNILTDGTIAVACLSLSSEPFDGNDGAILSITVDIEEDMELGNYPIMIDNMEMTSPNNAKYNVEKCVSTVTVTSYIPGDVNDDEKITISDAVGIVNFVVRANTEGLNEKAADANEDGSISISDAVFVINQVVRKDQSPVRNIEEDRKDAFLEMNSSYQTDEQFICIPVILQSEAFCITATELTLTLPAGVSLENITSENDHMTVYNVSEDGTVRIATLSLSNESYHGDGQAAFCLNLNISNDFTFGEIIISDVELVNNQLESIHPAARSSLLYHNNSVGIDSVSDDIHSTYGFDLFGRMNKSNSNGFKLYESKKNYMINK